MIDRAKLMLVTNERRFTLTVTNLPPQINFSFVDQTSNARVTSVRFDEGVSKHCLALRLSIPPKLDISMIDKTINLQAWAVTTQQLEALNALRIEHNLQDIPREKLDTLQGARADLALIPRGSARLEILIGNLCTEILPRQSLAVKAELYNNGTLELFDSMPGVAALRLDGRGDAQIHPAAGPRGKAGVPAPCAAGTGGRGRRVRGADRGPRTERQPHRGRAREATESADQRPDQLCHHPVACRWPGDAGCRDYGIRGQAEPTMIP
jgi:hypothetical protein